MSGYRVAGGADVDRSRACAITVDGQAVEAYHGETVAAALLATGRASLTASAYARRPRGLVSAGAGEPNVFVAVRGGVRATSMAAATEVLVEDGLDLRIVSGRAPLARDYAPPRAAHVNVHRDVLVIGGGVAGLAAAAAASDAGADVLLVSRSARLASAIDRPGVEQRYRAWRDEAVRAITAAGGVEVLTGARAIARYDANLVFVRCPADGERPDEIWRVWARDVVVATGASERPILFEGNDRPGVMLASAIGDYLRRFGVAAGRRAVLFTTDDTAYAVAAELLAAGVEVAAVVDARHGDAPPAAADLGAQGVRVLTGHAVARAQGADHVTAVDVCPRSSDGLLDRSRTVTIDCDHLGVSGGWDPDAALVSPDSPGLRWSESVAAFVPQPDAESFAAGACAGVFDLDATIAGGATAGAAAAVSDRAGVSPAPRATTRPAALWHVADEASRADEIYVDPNRDVTLEHVDAALAAGLRQPEHVKRHTTVGTGHDQGRLVRAVFPGVIAQRRGATVPEVLPTRGRPPVAPVPFAVLAQREGGPLHDPIRRTPMHAWHESAGAVFENVGQWKRPFCYPRAREDEHEAVRRECRAVRRGVGVLDVSTLGKIDVQGPDAPRFLDLIYTNSMSTLAVGAARYGVMCHLDGMVYDDGVVMRDAEDRYLVTTTTGNAAGVLAWMEEWLQCEWPELQVHVASLTDGLGAIAVAGPEARALLQRHTDLDLSAEAFAFMRHRPGVIAGHRGRVARVSFSGELAFEIYVAADVADEVWRALLATPDVEVTAYGTEALHVLRAEKGLIIVGQETDGTVTPLDLDMGWIIGKDKADFLGRRSLSLPAATRPDRRRLVGLRSRDGTTLLPEGAQLVAGPDGRRSVGHVTSSYRSEAVGAPIALALVERGRDRDEVHAVLENGETVVADVCSPVFWDPEGVRRDG